MIQIQKNQINTCFFTLTEKTNLLLPKYIFSFTNDLTKSEVVFYCQDMSQDSERYNVFVIEENIIPDLLNGIISLTDTGFYSYKIYESETIELTTTNKNMVESGKIFVTDLPTLKFTFENGQIISN